jgi:hypothetical protein
MSLLDNAFEPFKFMTKERVPDGVGGFITTWTEGAEFSATSRLDNSTVAKIAQAQGVTAVYTIITRKNITLEFHDVVKRVRDGKIFRVTSDGDDKRTPSTATLDMRSVSAEEWSLPND